MTLKVVLAAVLLVAAVALPVDLSGSSGPETLANYEFQYGVNDDLSGNDYGHRENRDGDFTQGSYHVKLPDGRMQKVTYSVKGDSGFVAQVAYEGEARHPAP